MSTYLRRRGRLTGAQSRAIGLHGGAAVIPAGTDGPIDWAERFARAAPLGLEIGFGMGQALLDWAQAQPALNLIGIEVYQPGIGALLQQRAELQIEQLLVIEDDANDALEQLFAPGALDEIRIFFPDPWPKKRHNKRRLIQPSFARLLASRLVPGGCLRLATDWEPYALWMLKVLEAEPQLVNESSTGFVERFEQRPVTRFEARGQRLGHEVWDLAYTKAS